MTAALRSGPQVGTTRLAACLIALRPKPASLRFLTAAALACVLPLGAAAQAPTPQQIDDGRQVYEEFCATCHGRDMVSPGLVTFDLRKFPKDDLPRFRNSVLDGKPPGMPAWRDKLGNDDLNMLWAYVRGGP